MRKKKGIVCERAIPSSIKPELLQSLLDKGGLTNERKIEPDASLKESATKVKVET